MHALLMLISVSIILCTVVGTIFALCDVFDGRWGKKHQKTSLEQDDEDFHKLE